MKIRIIEPPEENNPEEMDYKPLIQFFDLLLEWDQKEEKEKIAES